VIVLEASNQSEKRDMADDSSSPILWRHESITLISPAPPFCQLT